MEERQGSLIHLDSRRMAAGRGLRS